MKKLIILLVFLISSLVAFSNTCTSLGSGNWNDTATWSCEHVPGDGDTVVIAVGDTVNFDCVGSCNTYVGVHIQIDGVLNFEGGKKIILDVTSTVGISTTGSVTGGNGGSWIEIDGTSVWHGCDTCTISGPAYVDSTTTSFAPGGLPVEMLWFDGEIKDENVCLEWATISEINNDYFLISRSVDGYNFEEIGIVSGSRTSVYLIEYEFIDFDLLDGISYYMLEQFDYNGDSENHGIIVIHNKEEKPKLIKIINIMGQEVGENYDGIMIFIYDDGTTMKIVKN